MGRHHLLLSSSLNYQCPSPYEKGKEGVKGRDRKRRGEFREIERNGRRKKEKKKEGRKGKEKDGGRKRKLRKKVRKVPI